MGKLERGEHRPIYVALLNGPDFQALSRNARALFYPVKLALGALGIAVVPGGTAVFAEWTGMEIDEVEDAADELERQGWIRRDRNVWWLVRGLEFEPSMDSDNKLHRTFIARQWSQLPNLKIREDFRAYYARWFDATGGGIEGPSKAPAITSTSTSTSTTTSTKGSRRAATRAPVSTSWPGKVSDVLALVGPVSPGFVGKKLADFVKQNPYIREHGTDLLVAAAKAYAEHATSARQDPRFLKHPKDFFDKAGVWVDKVRPGGAADELGVSA